MDFERAAGGLTRHDKSIEAFACFGGRGRALPAGVAPGQRVTAIIRRCAERHRVSAADILGHTRRAHVVSARWEAIKLVAQAFPEFSTTRLGEIFNRDHTSILYALGRLSSAKKQNRRAAQ